MESDDRYTRITLRLPKDLHARLSEAADDTSKSMNAEIVARLQSSFDPPVLSGSGPLIVEGQKQSYAISNLSQLLRAAALHYERHAQLLEQSAKVRAEIEETEHKFSQLSRTIHDPSKSQEAAVAVVERAEVIRKQDQLKRQLATLNQELAAVEEALRGVPSGV